MSGCLTAPVQGVATAEPDPAAETAVPASPSEEDLRVLLEKRIEVNGVGVVVGLIDSDGTTVVAAGGRSSAPDHRPLDGDTVFQIGSVTKGITSLLLADMVVRGEVGLDDPAERYLPDGVTIPRKGRPITLRDLADHVSGLPLMPTNFDLNGEPDPIEAYTVEDLHDFLSTFTPERAPEEKEVYSNLGVALLGRLLANRMNTTYEALLKERVLQPLGMDSSSITLNDDQLARLAVGHDRYLQPVRTMEMRTLQASGSLRSTANDLLKLLAAYTGHRESPLAPAMTLQLKEELGWGVRPDGAMGHSGGKAGYRSAVLFDPKAGVGAVVLANARTYEQPMTLARHFVAGEPLEPPPPPPAPRNRVMLPAQVLTAYAGKYKTEDGASYEVAVNGANLLVRYPNTSILEFVADGRNDFFYHGGNDEIVFVTEGNRKIVGMKIYGDGKAAESFELARREPD